MIQYDILITGGGVIGSAVARELSRYQLSIGVVDKASDVCTQTSGRNTGMLHAGFLYKTGSMKAVCCVEGNGEFDQVARELDVPFRRTGKLIVGFTEAHRQRLLAMIQRGKDNGVPGMVMIDRQQMDELDPSAGLQSARISEMLGIPGHVIQPVKGEYFVLDKKAGAFAKIPVYPAPTEKNTFDIHATPTVDGNVLVGPNSFNVPDGEDYSVCQAGMDDLQEMGAKMFRHMERDYYIRTFAGARPKRIDPATGEVQDFLLECPDHIPGVVNLIGIESPGLTSALPIARRVVGMIAAREPLVPNPHFNPVRRGISRFFQADRALQRQMVADNPDYGEIVCRCENVTRAEIVAAIHNPLGVHTVNGIKVRTRASMGRCQGGYCETRITALLQEELGIPPTDIRLTNGRAWMFTGRVKG